MWLLPVLYPWQCVCVLIQAEVKANRTAVVAYRPGGAKSVLLTIPYLFSGESVSLHQAYLVWLPFSLPEVCEQ